MVVPRPGRTPYRRSGSHWHLDWRLKPGRSSSQTSPPVRKQFVSWWSLRLRPNQNGKAAGARSRNDRHARTSRVEDGRGSCARKRPPRFPSSLIKPDVLISSIPLSDRRHRTTHGGRPLCAHIRCGTQVRSPNTSPKGNHAVPRLLTRQQRLMARWIARPPEAAFVTRLRPVRLPVQAARQLRDQSTTLWAESSSAGDTRLRSAPKRSQFSSGSASSFR